MTMRLETPSATFIVSAGELSPHDAAAIAKVERYPAGPNEIQRVGDGRKKVTVDGITWAVVHMERRGVHGAVYTFQQARNGPRISGAQIWSDRVATRRNDFKAVPSVVVRLLDEARRLIREGFIVAPADYAEQVNRRNTEIAKAHRASEAKKDAEFGVRAAVAIERAQYVGHLDFPDLLQENLVREIVAAMKWAQTK